MTDTIYLISWGHHVGWVRYTCTAKTEEDICDDTIQSNELIHYFKRTLSSFIIIIIEPKTTTNQPLLSCVLVKRG